MKLFSFGLRPRVPRQALAAGREPCSRARGRPRGLPCSARHAAIRRASLPPPDQLADSPGARSGKPATRWRFRTWAGGVERGEEWATEGLRTADVRAHRSPALTAGV